MIEKQYKVARVKSAVATAESKLREALNNLREGQKKQNAILIQAQADAEKECYRLKEEVRRAENDLSGEKAWLEFTEAELARGFEA